MHCQNYIWFSSYMLREVQSQFANFPRSKALDEQCYSVMNNVLTDNGVEWRPARARTSTKPTFHGVEKKALPLA